MTKYKKAEKDEEDAINPSHYKHYPMESIDMMVEI